MTPLHIHSKLSLQNPDSYFNRLYWETEKSELEKYHKDIKKSLFNVCSYLKNSKTIVYSTESISEACNENVVKSAAKQIFLEKNELNIGELKIDTVFHEVLCEVYSEFLNFKDTSIGTLVYPTKYKNYGPFYLCKLIVSS